MGTLDHSGQRSRSMSLLLNVIGLLYRTWIEVGSKLSTHQLVLPESLCSENLKLLHSNPCSGHLGVKRTLARLRRRFYWVH